MGGVFGSKKASPEVSSVPPAAQEAEDLRVGGSKPNVEPGGSSSAAGGDAGEARCKRSGCDKSSWNGQSGEFCCVECSDLSKEEEARVAAVAAIEELKARVPFSLPDLEAEIDALRADHKPWLSNVGYLQVPKLVCNSEGELSEPKGDGPWDLIVCVRGEEGDLAYGFPLRISMRFDDDWPMRPPQVRFQCVMHHALTDDSGGMLAPFYRTMPDNAGVHTMEIVLQAVHDFLVDPMKAWGVAENSINDRVKFSLESERGQSQQRFDTITKYSKQCLTPDFFASPAIWKDEWLDPGLVKAMKENTPEAWRAILTEHLPGEVFSFKTFSEEFLEKMVAEIFNFYESGLPARRPNSMNNYGIILNEIGLEPLIDEFQRLLQPLGELLFPGGGNCWDGHHCFIVRYRAGEDLGLDMHTDDSDVTFNCCLGLDFEGAGLQFCGMMGAENHRQKTHTYQHVRGTTVCHLGRKRHGADDISSGERLNIILWNHSSTYRQSEEYNNPPYSQEGGPPDEVCLSYTHDRDYGVYKEYPDGKENFRGRGWCPPEVAKYEGFKPDSENETGGG